MVVPYKKKVVVVLVSVFVVGVHFSLSKNNANTTIICVGVCRMVPEIVNNGF